ncbi:G/U mismatch-specific DNA glycosylase [Pseudomonas putida]|uniref:G/U mismatch-specific DNA glycosylase n=1 Tax=Pseudomonas TaxID=286 RepID=UPI002363FB5D|nr:G/U mismatch-specific DNA glycosylase [Pseudomonas putida]MDD2018515.1 G/U mismatch-specific DNA glycosylase [Pseudomonas putida]HDS1775096.1 G/U mismatch-specific DNA glycosylase [Pseudomonas putida]
MNGNAAGEGLADILTEGLSVVFCGINPGLLAAREGHHFAGRGNRFWRTLYLAGFTPHELSPQEDRSLLHYGCGLTAVVERPTARADQVSASEFSAVAARFEQKIARYAPRYVAFLGKAAYAGLSGRKELQWGLQAESFGSASVWILPNPSGRNLAFNREQLSAEYRKLYQASDESPSVW